MPLTPISADHRLASSHRSYSGKHSRQISAFFMSGIQGSQPLSNNIKIFMEDQSRILPVTVRVSGRVVTGEYNTRKGNSQSRLYATRDTRSPHLTEVNILKRTGTIDMKTTLKKYHLLPVIQSSNGQANYKILACHNPKLAQRLAHLIECVVIGWTPLVRRSFAAISSVQEVTA